MTMSPELPKKGHAPSPDMQGGNVSRRHVLSTLALLPIAGCSASPVLSPAISQAFQQLKYTVNGMPATPVSREYVEKLPYASMLARIGRGPESLVILYAQDKNRLSWIAADRTVFITENGRIVQTGGLEKGLSGTLFHEADSLLTVNNGKVGMINRLIDLPYRNQFSIPIKGEMKVIRTESISILDRTYQTRVIEENGSAPLLKWEFTNIFWIDNNTGQVIQSLQSVTPDLPPIRTAIAKPAALYSGKKN